MTTREHLLESGPRRLSIATLLVAAAAGCGADTSTAGTADETINASPIIGGYLVSDATRRAMGLIDVDYTKCSGALITPDWVLTAAHCVRWDNPYEMFFRAPRLDTSVMDARRGWHAVAIGTADLAMVHLQPAAAGDAWPVVHRQVDAADAGSWVGRSLTCYGRGLSRFNANGIGVDGFGVWQSLSKRVYEIFNDPIAGEAYHVLADNSQAFVWGDSGSNCFSDSGDVVGVEAKIFCSNWQGMGLPGDPGCNAQNVITITGDYLPALANFRTYISEAPSRANVTFQPLPLQNGWQPAPYGTNQPGVGISDSIVRLRGGLAQGSSSTAFTLPAGMRPPVDVYLPVDLCGATKGRLIVSSSGAVDIQADGGYFENAQCFTSLEGASFAIDNSGFGVLSYSLANGWYDAPYGTRAAAVTSVDGIVRFQGAVAGGSSGPLVTLAPGQRPSSRVYVPVDLCAGKKGRLMIEPDGSVLVGALGSFGYAQCFTSLEGASFAIDSSGFETLSLQNGWTPSPYDTRPPAVRNVNGIITFQGAMETSGTNMVAFTLPSAMRPATPVYIPVDLCNTEIGHLNIRPDGTVSVEEPAGSSAAQCFTSLEGASFGI